MNYLDGTGTPNELAGRLLTASSDGDVLFVYHAFPVELLSKKSLDNQMILVQCSNLEEYMKTASYLKDGTIDTMWSSEISFVMYEGLRRDDGNNVVK